MARLPQPGADKGTWGDILNDFLNVSLSTDGSLKPVAATNVTGLANVATSGNYTDLQGKPALSTVATSGVYADLTGKPTFSTVATTGSYADLANKPTLSTVASTGSYTDLTNKPTIPTVPVQSVAGKTGTVTLVEGDIANLTSDLASLNTTASAALVAPTTTTVKTANYTASANQFVPVDATGGNVTITLPYAPADKSQVTVKRLDSSAATLTVSTSGTDTINVVGGPTSFLIVLQSQATTVQYAAATKIWYATTSNMPLGGLDGRYATPASVTSATAGTVNGASLSGRTLNFTTVGGSNINAGTVVPNLTVGTVTTGAYTANAAATIGGTSTDPTLSLTIPQGTPGDLTYTTSSSGTTATITAFPSTYVLTMTGNVTAITLPTPSASVAGTVTLQLIQDATGGRTVTWPTIKWNEGVAPQPSAAASSLSMFSLFWNGSQWIGWRAGQNFA